MGLMTEAEAAKVWCPEYRVVAVRPEDGDSGYQSNRPNVFLNTPNVALNGFCLGSKCGTWQPTGKYRKTGPNIPCKHCTLEGADTGEGCDECDGDGFNGQYERQGYCGKGGRPEELVIMDLNTFGSGPA